ncbi:hypothetical protein GQ53DRAFT_804505 [Thozetella sp. PMI_491]|nr:hypothetical protein GQ53DRAFT_804505 [Thozetella sp. PMI_491]
MKRVALSGSEDQTASENASSRSSPTSQSPSPTPDSLSSEQQPSHTGGPARAHSVLPAEFTQILVPSLKVGGITGSLGLFTGCVVSILRYSPNPVLWSISTSVQWFTLGSSYYATRLATLGIWGQNRDELSISDKVKVSALAGGVAGAMGGLLVGPRNVLPGIFVWSLAGAAGQKVVGEFQERRDMSDPVKKQSWLDSKWSPLHKMTDTEYHNYLQEKILSVEAEIAIIDDHIRDLRASKDGKQPSSDAGGKPSSK